jgi:hypothetical protein
MFRCCSGFVAPANSVVEVFGHLLHYVGYKIEPSNYGLKSFQPVFLSLNYGLKSFQLELFPFQLVFLSLNYKLFPKKLVVLPSGSMVESPGY